jgi:hypothetical protein
MQQQEKALSQVKEVNQRMLQQQQAQIQQQRMQYRQDQDRLLLAALPELADAKTRETFKSELRNTLKEHYRFTDDEIVQWFNGDYDHRYFTILKDAQKYRQMELGKKVTPRKVVEVPAVKPKLKSTVAKPDDARTKAKDRLRKSGSDRAALDVLDSMELLQ